jgi:hypothetical protein
VSDQPQAVPQSPTLPSPIPSDLEYDLAHEWAGGPRVPHARPSVYVATETVDTGGDYGYDLAHDVPGR